MSGFVGVVAATRCRGPTIIRKVRLIIRELGETLFTGLFCGLEIAFKTNGLGKQSKKSVKKSKKRTFFSGYITLHVKFRVYVRFMGCITLHVKCSRFVLQKT